jgi:L-Ala-D/L-Glu epimerase
MRIRQLTAFVVRLPLKRPFAHASAVRNETENELVRCELADGTAGWGEGVPRSYITGETPDGCLAQLTTTPVADLLSADCGNWPSVLRLCSQFTPTCDRSDPRGRYGNALRCAVELGILDAFGQLLAEPIHAAARHFEPAGTVVTAAPKEVVCYSAVIGAGDKHLWRQALVRRLYGFRHCKVKIGAAGDDDVARLRTIRNWAGGQMDLRADANEAWPASQLRARLAPLERFHLSCIEQPVPHAEVAALAELREQVAIPIMLDESLTSERDARGAIDGRLCDLFNIRLSKCGGFLSSLRLAAMAKEAGLGFQLGCHPGETGILSAAGRHWASAVDGLRYLEGSYDQYLFRRQITNEDITFGYGGRAPALSRPGLGVTVNLQRLGPTIVRQQSFAVS